MRSKWVKDCSFENYEVWVYQNKYKIWRAIDGHWEVWWNEPIWKNIPTDVTKTSPPRNKICSDSN
jgi:hypothetical protein